MEATKRAATTSQSESESPKRCIFNDADMKHFLESKSKQELLGFVEAMGKSCSSAEGGSSTSAGSSSFDPSNPLTGLTPSMASLHGSLAAMIKWVDDFPPTTAAEGNSSIRFGNPAFRQWHGRLLERSHSIIRALLEARDDPNRSIEEAARRGLEAATPPGDSTTSPKKEDEDPSIQQVSCYLHDSFGHATRLDYGTGHESSFLVFLLVLSKVKCLGETPTIPILRATAISIFDQYLQLTRRLQTDYRLEPAGSHGVWGLDDYHCLPFYFGACQLQAASVAGVLETDLLTKPGCIDDSSLLKDYGDNYLYLSCIRYIRQLKQGVPFFESSPMLFDISQTLSTWDRVARGMLRLYQGEVLEKRVVVQHFVFSKFFSADWTPSQDERSVPTETFRTGHPASQQRGGVPAVPPPTAAPWARDGSSSAVLPAAALDSNAHFDPMQPTKAPWAK